jgi:hypothetical protein
MIAPDGDRVKSYVDFVLRSIKTLRFIIDWNNKTQIRGGKAWKTQYRDRYFEEHYAKELTFLRENYVGAYLLQQLNSLRRQFFKRHEKVITSRNQLMRMYYTVCG